jgi:hypothetical protein
MFDHLLDDVEQEQKQPECRVYLNRKRLKGDFMLEIESPSLWHKFIFPNKPPVMIKCKTSIYEDTDKNRIRIYFTSRKVTLFDLSYRLGGKIIW